MPRKNWAEQDIERLREFATRCLSAQQIAKMFRVTACSINNQCANHGIKLKPLLPDLPTESAEFKSRLWHMRVFPRLVANGECLEWVRASSSAGYGQIRAGGKIVILHRLAYEVSNGVSGLPPGLFVCHKCDNPRCCNPQHLFLGTPVDNARDMMNKGRGNGQFVKGVAAYTARGEKASNAKLTEEEVLLARKIHKEFGIGHKRLAPHFGISKAGMAAILKRRTWTHI